MSYFGVWLIYLWLNCSVCCSHTIPGLALSIPWHPTCQLIAWYSRLEYLIIHWPILLLISRLRLSKRRQHLLNYRTTAYKPAKNESRENSNILTKYPVNWPRSVQHLRANNRQHVVVQLLQEPHRNLETVSYLASSVIPATSLHAPPQSEEPT